jgi:hypothetical protein
MEEFASAAFGIEVADTDKLGVVVALVTLGVSHDGQFVAAKLVTVPDDELPQLKFVPL